MTTPAPVSAYAAVSPDGKFYCAYPSEPAAVDATIRNPTITAREMLSITNVPVIVLPNEQYEAMVKALEEAKDFITGIKADAEFECDEFEASEVLDRIAIALAALKEQTPCK